MAKRIAYLIVGNGEDGRGPTEVHEAYWEEAKRDKAFAHLKFPSYYRREERIVDVGPATFQALVRIDALQALLIGVDKRWLPRK